MGLRARRRAGEAAVLSTRTSFAPAAGAAARLCSTPRRSVRGCRRILEEPAPSARRLLFLPTHRVLFLTSCRGAEGLAPVALRSRTGSESGERLRISCTLQRNLFRLGLLAVAPPRRGALSSLRRRAWIGVPVWRYARVSPRFPSPHRIRSVAAAIAAVRIDKVAGSERSPSFAKLFLNEITCYCSNNFEFSETQRSVEWAGANELHGSRFIRRYARGGFSPRLSD